MKVKLDKVITTLDGKPLVENGITLTVGIVLASTLDAGKGNDGAERLSYYYLARKCYDGKEEELTPDEVFMLRKVLGTSEIQSNVIVGQILDALNG